MLAINRVLVIHLLTLALSAAQSAREEGLLAFQQGKYSIALKKFTEASQNSADRTAHAFLALTQAALHDCKTALPGLTAKQNAEDPVLFRLTGLAAVKCYSGNGNQADAFSLLEQLERQFPNDADVLYTSAKLHMKAFNDATLAMFQRTPASYRVHELSAEIFEVQNRYSEAIAEYRKAITLNPKAPDLHFRLGRAILMEAHGPETLEQARAEFSTELKINPEDGACEFQLGQIAQVQGKNADAAAHFQRALSLSPSFVEAMIALGKLRSQDKLYTEAISLLERATQLQPANERAHYVLLTAYRNAGQLDKAKREKETLDHLQKAPQGEFSNFLKRLGEKPPPQ
jgi:tetratricopeptide (TPR) repeat protein